MSRAVEGFPEAEKLPPDPCSHHLEVLFKCSPDGAAGPETILLDLYGPVPRKPAADLIWFRLVHSGERL